jgi:putative ABC transport system permease protein
VPLSVTVRIRGADAEDIIGYAVTSNYFALLGLEPSLGRALLPSEERSGAESAVAVIGHTLWRRYFGSDPAVIGASLVINDRTFTVIGVGPERFGGTEPLAPDVWVPIGTQSTVAPGADLLNDRGAPWLLVAGRLKPGVSRDAAGAPLNVVAQRLAADHPAPGRPVAVELAAGTFFPVDPALRPLILLVLCIVTCTCSCARPRIPRRWSWRCASGCARSIGG